MPKLPSLTKYIQESQADFEKNREWEEDEPEGEESHRHRLIPFPDNTTVLDTEDYDWYKFGVAASDLDDVDPTQFQQGDSDIIVVPFGNKDADRLLPLLKHTGIPVKRLGKEDRPEITKESLALGYQQVVEYLKKVKGRWALVSKTTGKPLQYYRGPKDQRPSDEWVKGVERRVHSFEQFNDMERAIMEGGGSLEDYYTSLKEAVAAQVPKEIENKIINSGLNFERITVGKDSHFVIDYSDRKMVLVNINNILVPMYLSTGEGGKANVPAGRWYPFFGVGPDGWINKANEDSIMKFYGSRVLKYIADKLNASLGDIRSAAVPLMIYKPALSNINAGLKPVTSTSLENRDPAATAQFKRNVNSLVTALGDQPFYKINESAGVGVVANKKQARDPRYIMSLTKDVQPGEVARQAAKFGNKLDKNGLPPRLGESTEDVKTWIKQIYDKYPASPLNSRQRAMVWGEGDDQQFAIFELTPNPSRKNAVEVTWFQAYPLRQGVGTRAMQELQAQAKSAGVTLTLYPWDKGQVSQSKLIKFYKQSGFKPTTKGAKTMQWTPEGIDIDEWVEYQLQEDASAGATGAGAVAVVSQPMGSIWARDPMAGKRVKRKRKVAESLAEGNAQHEREYALIKKLGQLGTLIVQSPKLWDKYTQAVDRNNVDWVIALIQDVTGANKEEVMHLAELFGEIGGGLARLIDFAWAVKEGTWVEDFVEPWTQHRGLAEGSLNEFAGGGRGDDDGGEDPYKYPQPEHYSRSIDFFGRFEADHFDREDMNDVTGEFKGYWGNTQIAYFKFDNPAKTGSDDPGMGWYYEPQNESVAEGEVIPAYFNQQQRQAAQDARDREEYLKLDAAHEEKLKRLAAWWWNNDENTAIEKKLAKLGFEIGQDEGYENGGVFIVAQGDINGKTYISWPAEELEKINEAFDQPYRLKWEKGDYGDVDALAKMADGNYLSIMFNQGYNQDKEEAWNVEFYRNNSQEVTGEGDQQRVFATVLSAIQTFIKKYKPNRIIFSASKEVDNGQKSQSRAKLYDSLVQRYAKSWGFKAFRAETGNKVIYELSRISPVEEGWREKAAAAAVGAAAVLGGQQIDKYYNTNMATKPAQQQLAQKPATPKEILEKTARAAGLTGQEFVQFMAQCAHESLNFTRMIEIGTPQYFMKKYDKKFAPKTARILGNKLPGDGELFKGRGFIQLTGRDNYARAGQALGLDLVNNPDLAAEPNNAARIAVWYWQNRVAPKVQDFTNTKAVTKKINPAGKGMKDRKDKVKQMQMTYDEEPPQAVKARKV